MKLTKSELNSLIRECIKEELSRRGLTEGMTAEEKVDAWHNGTRRENYKAAGIPKLLSYLDIAESKGYTEIVEIIEGELAKRGEPVAPKAPAAPVEPDRVDWNELIRDADDLLLDLICASDNREYDDCDGYWLAEEGHIWCTRYLYYTDKLNDSDRLTALCKEYSSKLPNVTFYYVEDDFMTDDAVSEIGYEATNPGYIED